MHAAPGGVAATELAVCLPVLVLLVCGSIQACDLLYLKHALVSGAYEGSLELAKPSSTNASVNLRITQLLDARGVQGAAIAISPSGSIATIDAGTTMTITVTAPTASNLKLNGFFPSPGNVSYSLVSIR
jgi:Flp pilus assembly protein TadG